MTNKIGLPLVLVAFAHSLFAAHSPRPANPVPTEFGLVRGVVEDDLVVYRGIPFAAPPVGDLRWRPPQPAAKWDGVRETTTFTLDPFQSEGKGRVT